MGMYSKNRFSSLSAEAVEKKLNEAAEAEKTPVEIDDDILALMSDDEDEPTVNIGEAVETLNSVNEEVFYDGLIETSINIDQYDKDINEALIKLDYLSIMQENANSDYVVSEADNEAKINKLYSNIDRIISGTSNAIYQEAYRLNKKVTELCEADKAIYEKYRPNINLVSLKEFSGINNFYFPNFDNAKALMEATSMNVVTDAIKNAITKISTTVSREEVNNTMDILKEELNSIAEAYNANIKKAMATESNWKPDEQQINYMKNYVQESYFTKAIAYSAKHMTNSLAAIAEASKVINEKDELAVYKANAIYNLISTACKIANKKACVYCDLIVREAAAIREAYLVCGKYANKPLSESAIDLVCESSRVYVFDYFEY